MKKVNIISTVVQRQISGEKIPTGNNVTLNDVVDIDEIRKELSKNFISFDEFKSYWEIKTDAYGNKYIYSPLHIATQNGITMYANEGGIDIPTILNSIPTAGYDDIQARGLIAFNSKHFVINNGVVSAIQGSAGLDVEQLDNYLKNNHYATEDWVKEYIVEINTGETVNITKQMVIDALGFTPYDASNPNGYITSATLDGYLPLKANAASATKLSDNTSFTIWGQTFFTNGKPQSVSGDLSGVGNVISSGAFIGRNSSKANESYFGNASSGVNGDGALMYAYGGRNLYFYTNGVERIRVDSSGKVGIGTTSPSAKLHVYGGATSIMCESNTSESSIYFIGAGTNSEYRWAIGKGVWGIGGKFGIGEYNTAKTLFVQIDTNGYVGIGVPYNNSPSERLHVNGSVKSEGGIIGTNYALGNESNNPYLKLSLNSINWYVQAYDSYMYLGKGISKSMRIDLDGNILSTGTITTNDSLTINGINIRKTQDGVLYLDGNLVVKGGVTMYGTDATSAPSILDSLPIASTSAKGIAQFSGDYFTVSDGIVRIIDGSVGLKESELNAILDGKNYATKIDLNGYLPLSGGVLTDTLTIKSGGADVLKIQLTGRDIPAIVFSGTSGSLGRLFIYGLNGSFYRTNNDFSAMYKIWDEGNDGSDSGLNADMLDGKHDGELTSLYTRYQTATTDAFASYLKTYGSVGFSVVENHSGGTIGQILSTDTVINFGSGTHRLGRFIFSRADNSGLLYFQTPKSDVSDWGAKRQVAFVDSNVASATYATTAGDADTVDGYHIASENTREHPWGKIPIVRLLDGVMEVGQYIDFHFDTSVIDYSTRIHSKGNHGNTVVLPSANGTLALTSDIPTNTNQLENGAGFITSSGYSAGVTDYYDRTSNISIGYQSSSLTASQIDYIAAYSIASGNIVIKDVDKSTMQSWLGLGSFAYKSSLAFSELTSKPTTISGYGITDAITTSNIGSQSVSYATSSGSCTGNAASATKLQTARTIWGQSFDGTGNVTGDLLLGFNRIKGNNDVWNDGTYDHTWYGLDMASGQNGVNSMTISSFFGLSLKTYKGVLCMTKDEGNVGIGTTAPAYPLDVNGTVCATELLLRRSLDNEANLRIYSPSSSGHLKIENHSGNGNILFTSNVGGKGLVDVMCVYGDKGYVGIGTTSPSAKLHVVGDVKSEGNIIGTNCALCCESNNPYLKLSLNNVNWYVQAYNGYMYLGIGISKALRVDLAGNLLTSGGVTMYSQRSLKNVLDERGLSLEELSLIKPTRYTWKDNRDSNIHFGGIADDIQQVLPEVVYKTKEGILTMDYGNAGFAIAASLIKPVVDHEQRIKALEKENELLKQELNRLRA